MRQKIGLIISGLCLVAFTGLVLSSKTANYELSIYTSSTPIIAWPLVLMSMLISIWLCLKEIDGDSKFWWWPMAMLVLAGVVILSLPVLKDYWVANRNDMMLHVGMAKDVANVGLQVNQYPVMHLIPALMIKLGLSANVAVGLMPALMGIANWGGLILISKLLFRNRRLLILTAICGALLLLPVSGYYASTCFFAILAILTFGAVAGLSHKRCWYTYLFYWVAILALGYSVGWFLSAKPSVLAQVINNGVELVTQNQLAQDSTYDIITKHAARAGFGFWETLWLIFKTYGGEMICGGLAIIAVVLCWNYCGRKYRIMGIIYLLLVTIYFVNFFGHMPVMFNMQPEYISRFTYIISPLSIIVAVPLLLAIKRLWPSWVLFPIIASVLIISVFNVYYSPWTYQANPMVSKNEIDGAKWFMENKIPYAPVAYQGIPLRYYGVAVYGEIEWREQLDWEMQGKKEWEASLRVPDHFGYDYNGSVAALYKMKTYIIITEYDRLVYQEVWKPPVKPRWTSDDYRLLFNDASVSTICLTNDFGAVLVE